MRLKHISRWLDRLREYAGVVTISAVIALTPQRLRRTISLFPGNGPPRGALPVTVHCARCHPPGDLLGIALVGGWRRVIDERGRLAHEPAGVSWCPDDRRGTSTSFRFDRTLDAQSASVYGGLIEVRCRSGHRLGVPWHSLRDQVESAATGRDRTVVLRG